ncbi:MAG TPA: hypothetical protein VIP70_13635 [Nitrososphaeraceae archaeon]|jgi:hypothetical protein
MICQVKSEPVPEPELTNPNIRGPVNGMCESGFILDKRQVY